MKPFRLARRCCPAAVPGQPATRLGWRRRHHRRSRLPGHRQYAGGQRHGHQHDREGPHQRDHVLVQGDRGQPGRRGARLGSGIGHPEGRGQQTRITERAGREPRRRAGHAVLDGARAGRGHRRQRLRNLPGDQPRRGVERAGQREPGRRHQLHRDRPDQRHHLLLQPTSAWPRSTRRNSRARSRAKPPRLRWRPELPRRRPGPPRGHRPPGPRRW